MGKEGNSAISTRRLEKQELKQRQDITARAVRRVLSNKHDHWSSWITAAYIYGSTAMGEARIDSDVDIAFISQMKFLTVEDSRSMRLLMSQAIEKEMERLKLQHEFKIQPNFIYKDWLNNPLNASITFPEVVENVKKEGIKIF
ncbi:MAG: nucleotidyltransferase domain-containing protein [Patescibacteria group bacterium]